MSPRELVEEHKIYLEDLERWVVPLEVVDQALAIKANKEVEENVKQLEESMQELNRVFENLSNIKF